jgi:GntR family transcriptional regulator/MocR family aminotransferase
LPSTRALAADLSISRSTVEAAYAQLEDEGYLTRSVGNGSYVSAGTSVSSRGPTRSIALRPSADYSDALSKRGRQIAALGDCIDPYEARSFSAGMPALESFPLAIWQRLMARRMSTSAPFPK